MLKYFPEVKNIFVMTEQQRINLYMKSIEYYNNAEKIFPHVTYEELESIKKYSNKIMYFLFEHYHKEICGYN